MIGVSAFPHGARRSQLDLIPDDSAAFAKAARTVGLKLSAKKSGFLIQGEDRAGAVADIMKRLSTAKINVTSVQVFYLAQAATAACSGSRHRTWAKPPKCLRSRNTPREAIPGVTGSKAACGEFLSEGDAIHGCGSFCMHFFEVRK